ncbi:hypothetical protein C8N35_10160 [Breoghania corrubedonensis]|uniref:YCII-related domain-containing protein n=1 Tax=Breoghania corrubedonensis TaxID=665038 RepID=A0A2T5VE51_9HYPH|nr:YciI family protein [Breoghania corrubedonensis]PTW62028.1 hypothetical protein C8N35_10160 [Breoghania corrubedonensis]
MYWAVWCEDGDDVAEQRSQNSSAHSQHLNATPIRMVMAGPLISDDGQKSTGSLLVFEADTREQVEKQMQSDPFVTSGVWTKVKISAFKMSRETISTAAEVG